MDSVFIRFDYACRWRKSLSQGNRVPSESDSGKVTQEIAKAFAESEFEKYRIVQDRLFESDFDRLLKGELLGG
jgi:hypothetical protein